MSIKYPRPKAPKEAPPTQKPDLDTITADGPVTASGRSLIRVERGDMVVMPPVEGLIADALQIISAELRKFNSKVSRGASLSPEEGRLLNGYIKGLTDMSKEQRERDKDANLGDLSTEELINLLKNKPGPSKGEPDGESNS